MFSYQFDPPPSNPSPPLSVASTPAKPSAWPRRLGLTLLGLMRMMVTALVGALGTLFLLVGGRWPCVGFNNSRKHALARLTRNAEALPVRRGFCFLSR